MWLKKDKVKDTMRIDATIPTILHIYRKGGKPILMTHVGRPYDKKSGNYTISEDESVKTNCRISGAETCS